MMKLPPIYRRRIVEASDVVTSNCQFQRNQFMAMGILTEPLCDIVPTDFYYTPRVQKRLAVVALGRISTDKNSQSIVDIFKALAGTGIERVYIGSANLWGFQVDEDAAIEHAIEDNCDQFHKNVPHPRVGRVLSEMAYGIFDSYHDCSSTSNQQALMSGIQCFYGQHGLWRERLGIHNHETPDDFVESLKRHSDDFKAKPSAPTRQRIEKWAKARWSPEVFLCQWRAILQKCEMK